MPPNPHQPHAPQTRGPSPLQPRILFVGGSGHHYLRPLKDEGAPSLFVSDPNEPQASKAWAEQQNVTVFDGSIAEAIGEFAPDVVSVGTVYARNGEYVIQALRAGVPVVTDKPMAANEATLAEIERLTAPSDAPGVATEFDWRARPELRAARAAIAAGRIGPIVLIVGQKSYRFGRRPDWYADPSLYGGTMLWIASHALDAVDFVTGESEPPRVCFAHGGNVSRDAYGSMEDHVTATLALANGGTAVVHADLLNPAASPTHGKDRLRIVGGHGELLVDEGRCILTTDDAGPTDLTDTSPATTTPTSLARQLLDAAFGAGDPSVYGTAASLRAARLLLAAQTALKATSP